MSKPTKSQKKMEVSSSDSDTEEFPMMNGDQECDLQWIEQCYREEVVKWLALNGRALFGLETNKFLAKQKNGAASLGLKAARK